MNELENSLWMFQPTLQTDFNNLNLLCPASTKFICSASQLPEIVASSSSTYRILDIEGARTMSNHIPFHDMESNPKAYELKKNDTEKSESNIDSLRDFGTGMQLFDGYKRIILTNQKEWITIDFDLYYTTMSGRVISFESIAVVGVYGKYEPDVSPIITQLENFSVPENTYSNYDINIVLLYSFLKLNMLKTKIRIIDNSIQ